MRSYINIDSMLECNIKFCLNLNIVRMLYYFSACSVGIGDSVLSISDTVSIKSITARYGGRLSE